jgi:hypothetical protein
MIKNMCILLGGHRFKYRGVNLWPFEIHDLDDYGSNTKDEYQDWSSMYSYKIDPPDNV